MPGRPVQPFGYGRRATLGLCSFGIDMWTANAEEDIHCTECAHVIPSGAARLSQAPPSLPKSRSRSEYWNYCVECTDCEVDASPCYVRWLDHRHDHAETPEAAACGYCGDAIPAGTLTAVQRLYDWPALDPRPVAIRP